MKQILIFICILTLVGCDSDYSTASTASSLYESDTISIYESDDLIPIQSETFKDNELIELVISDMVRAPCAWSSDSEFFSRIHTDELLQIYIGGGFDEIEMRKPLIVQFSPQQKIVFFELLGNNDVRCERQKLKKIKENLVRTSK